jgi:hypothetical protein
VKGYDKETEWTSKGHSNGQEENYLRQNKDGTWTGQEHDEDKTRIDRDRTRNRQGQDKARLSIGNSRDRSKGHKGFG